MKCHDTQRHSMPVATATEETQQAASVRRGISVHREIIVRFRASEKNGISKWLGFIGIPQSTKCL